MIVYSLLVFVFLGFTFGEDVVVNTPLGLVQGTVETTLKGTIYHKFEGIPYAKPPLRDLRFMPPEPVDPWTDIQVADRTVRCIQLGHEYVGVVGSEDCLYLYLSAPQNQNKNDDKPRDVMVFFHNGALCYGSGNYQVMGYPDYFMDKGVILVSINFRLGPLGFLSTEDRHAPGNFGLLDQIESLKWVQQNIASFGGNPDKVTIFGISAGSVSVLYHILSPLSKGLFQHVIAQSGSPINPWARTRIAAERAKTLAKHLDCSVDTSVELVECLRKKKAEDIVASSLVSTEKRWGISPKIWMPRIDSESENPYLPEDPITLMTNGKINNVSLIIGFTREDGLFLYPTFPYVRDEEIYELSSDWLRVCKLIINTIEFDRMEREAEVLCDKIRSHYLEEKDLSNVYHQRYIDLIGEGYYISGSYRTAKLMQKFIPVYLYSFEFLSKKTNLMRIRYKPDIPLLGVQHGDDKMYLFNYNSSILQEEPEKNMIELFTTVWTNFAKYGYPAFEKEDILWPKFEPPNYNYLRLDLPPTVQKNYRESGMKFWEDIYRDNWFSKERLEKDEL